MRDVRAVLEITPRRKLEMKALATMFTQPPEEVSSRRRISKTNPGMEGREERSGWKTQACKCACVTSIRAVGLRARVRVVVVVAAPPAP